MYSICDPLKQQNNPDFFQNVTDFILNP